MLLADYPAMLTIKDVAEITGLHVNSVRRLCRDGNIPSMKLGQKIMIPKDVFVEGLGISDGEGKAE
jgi:excisionase family DNA binding protein